MAAQELIARVNAIMESEFEADPATLTPESHLIDDIGLDSLDSVDLIAAMQREFQVKVPENEARQLRTLGDIYAFAERLMQGAA